MCLHELDRTQPFQIAFGHSVTSLRCIIRITTRSRSPQTSRELSLAPRLGNSRYLIGTRFTECYCYACEQSDHAGYILQPEIGFPLFLTTPVSFFPGRLSSFHLTKLFSCPLALFTLTDFPIKIVTPKGVSIHSTCFLLSWHHSGFRLGRKNIALSQN